LPNRPHTLLQIKQQMALQSSLTGALQALLQQQQQQVV
jgi:hypothetical protein